ncbi:ribose 5-phosphate isomerase A [Halobacteriales archaeon SW_8_68_21]|nr:MAG: ribose 5-phosphate isomerase A [Halobacteriales archaeon SW_8_68_21]
MKTSGGSDATKRRAGESAAEAVTDGDVVGLGTGSTAAHAIRRLGERVDAGLDARGVPTSLASRELALDAGVPCLDLPEAVGPGGPGIDLAVDGADQVAVGRGDDPAVGPLIKGGGAAHAREKLVDAAADRFLVVADPSKETPVLDGSVPVEVLPAGRSAVAESFLVFDASFGAIDDPALLSTTLSTTPGVVEHGLFVGLADEVHVGTESGVRVARR